jgi:hypothetical protein
VRRDAWSVDYGRDGRDHPDVRGGRFGENTPVTIRASEMSSMRRPAIGFEPGDYITDGIGLYRLLDPIGTSGDELVGVEDCRSLAVMLVPSMTLADARLRLVVGTAA